MSQSKYKPFKLRHSQNMNRLTVLIIFFLFSLASIHAAVDKKSLESIVKITTTNLQGQPIGIAWGVAIAYSDTTANDTIPQITTSPRTTILSPYTIFKHACKGAVSSQNGASFPIHRISGANDLYDVARFTIEGEGIPTLPLAKEKLHASDKAYILTGLTNKKQTISTVTIEDAQEYSGLTYYTLSVKSDTSLIGTPLLNANNEVVGIIQRSAASDIDKMYAIGIEFNLALGITTMSAADLSLNNIYIPKQLPPDQRQASSYIYLFTKNSEDTLSYLGSLADYIATYPTDPFGYTQRIEYYIATRQFSLAEQDYNAALASCTDKADIHHNFSIALYHLNQDRAYTPYKDWTLQRALDEANQAYALVNTPLFLMQKAKCLYALQQYTDAYDVYKEINQTDFRSSENLFSQARSLQMANGDSTEVLALLDSAVVRFKKPLRPDAAPYIYYRAQQYHRYQQYPQAVLGYQDYQDLIGIKNLNDNFFYIKEQAEFSADFYPQALADIERAIAINPNEYVYYIEKALIETRLESYEDAVISAKQAQNLDANDPGCYKIMGIAYGEMGNLPLAEENLKKAIALGDTEAQSWLDSFKKRRK